MGMKRGFNGQSLTLNLDALTTLLTFTKEQRNNKTHGIETEVDT